jgi:hypothetical protein
MRTFGNTHPFRYCARCRRAASPPYLPGWQTAKDGSWRCPECRVAVALHASQRQTERAQKLVPA